MNKTKQRRRKALANCEFSRDGDNWQLKRNGKLVVTGLTLQQMLAIIRGEVRVTDLGDYVTLAGEEK